MFSYLTLAQRIGTDHPARQIRALVDRALEQMDAELEKLYSDTSSIGKTLSPWRRMSTSPMYTVHSMPNSAAAVAVATPCCRAGLGDELVLAHPPGQQALADTLLSLWDRVWARASRFKSSRTPRWSQRRPQVVTGVGRPP